MLYGLIGLLWGATFVLDPTPPDDGTIARDNSAFEKQGADGVLEISDFPRNAYKYCMNSGLDTGCHTGCHY